MKLNAPKVVTFWIAVILAVIGFLAFMGILPIAGSIGFWFLVVGFVLLMLGNMVKGL